MPDSITSSAPNPKKSHLAAFFRQSGWLMITSIGSGALMYAVHFLSKKISVAEYAAFTTLLAVVMWVPATPLQMVFAQQTAKALATSRERELAGILRWAAALMLGLGVALGIATWMWQQSVLTLWKISHPADLWVTLGVVLFSMWMPVVWGVMQGQQNFLWLGWANVVNGIGRVTIAVFLVMALGMQAAGMMGGVCAGLALAAFLGAWQTRRLWVMPSQPFDWRALLAQAGPLLVGFACVQFLFTSDAIFVKLYFTDDETGFYNSAGTLSRALLWVVMPMATVMFPKIVHSVARSEKNNLFGMVLLATGILAVVGAVCLTLLGPWVIRLVYKDAYVQVASSVLPWYAGAMVPLSLAYVLVNNLLARGRYKIVPVLVVLAVAYGFALVQFHGSLVTVLKTLGVFNLLLLLACAWFTWFGGTSSSEKAE